MDSKDAGVNLEQREWAHLQEVERTENNRKRHLAYGLSVAALLLLFAPILFNLFQFSLGQKHYSHMVLIPIVSLYFLITERHKIFSTLSSDWRPGLVALLGSMVFYLAGFFGQDTITRNDYFVLTAFSFVLALVGLFLCCYGSRAARAAAFPLAFLVFMIPIPTAILKWIVYGLQAGSTEITDMLFQLTGVPVYREGFFFTLPGLKIEVAPQCSGIRSTIALVITGVLVFKLFLKRWWKAVVLFSAILLISVFKNGLRIVALCLLTIYVDEGFISGDLHEQGGIFFFVLALAMLAPVVLLLRK